MRDIDTRSMHETLRTLRIRVRVRYRELQEITRGGACTHEACRRETRRDGPTWVRFYLQSDAQTFTNSTSIANSSTSTAFD